MYFVEWLAWLVAIDPKEAREEFEKNNKTPKNRKLYESEDNEDVEIAKKIASDTPKSRGPVYAFNEQILEMRCGMWESKRGLISIMSATVIGMILAFFFMAIRSTDRLFTLIQGAQTDMYGARIFMTLFALTMALGMSWLYLKYGLRFTRLEMFTSRHLLIRFNRTTQQVYLHRPSYCGGITVLPWHGVSSTGSHKDHTVAGGVGLPLSLLWSSNYTGTLRGEVVWVGKTANNFQELQAEWEFIRRFMDEGPEGLPRPAITSHFPWPWQAFTPQFEGMTQYFRKSPWVIKCGLVLISPAFLIAGTGHWLSLLLCWKPRWPKIIREAGLPGKPTPAITTVDDYPLNIQERLRENAYIWTVHPGERPKRKPRATTRRSKPKASEPTFENDESQATP